MTIICKKYYNEGKARIKGIEATANFDTGPLTHTVSYDYVDARNAITDTPLPRRSKQMAKYQLDWDVYDFDWGVTYQYLGSRYDSDYSAYPYRTVKWAASVYGILRFHIRSPHI